MRCPLCDSANTAPSLAGHDRLLETTAQLFHLSECRACDCLFLDPAPSPGELAAFYPETYWRTTPHGNLGLAENLYRRAVLRDHVTFIDQAASVLRLAGKTPRLLDVGCGAGLLLSLVRRRGFEVMGVDVSPHAVRLAAAQDDIPVQAGTLDAARFPAGHFDIVTMFHILEHVTDPRAALQEAGRVLQPHGKLILQVPNIRSWQCRMFRTRWHGLDIPRHTIDFSPRSLVRLLAACGFHVERMRNFNLRDNAPAFASSVAPWLDPMRRASRPTLKRTEGRISAWMMHLVYLGLVALSYPFALLEAAAGCGATLMVEARKV